MKIPVSNTTRHIEYIITYLYPSGSGVSTQNFEKIDSFQEFMSECHPDVDTDEFVAKYGKKLAELNDCGSSGSIDVYYVVLYCFVGGDMIMSSFAYCGIMEKWHEYHEGHDKTNEGYLHTFICHNWQFNQLPTGIMKISYWHDPSNKETPAYKVHLFKDKVIFERANGVVHTIIVTDKHYVYYEGLKKPEQ